MSFLQKVAGLFLRDRMRSLADQEGLRAETLFLHIERTQLTGMLCGHLLGEVVLGFNKNIDDLRKVQILEKELS